MGYRDQQDSPTQPLNASRRTCCFFPTTKLWQKIKPQTTSLPSSSSNSNSSSSSKKWWDKGMTALKKLREWSELVAGPKWKTFIRRFNKPVTNRDGKFQYDPLSYALNFDDGAGQYGNFRECRSVDHDVYPSGRVEFS